MNIFTIKQITERCWEFHLELYQMFIHFQQAFDSLQDENVGSDARTWLLQRTGQSDIDLYGMVKMQGEGWITILRDIRNQQWAQSRGCTLITTLQQKC